MFVVTVVIIIVCFPKCAMLCANSKADCVFETNSTTVCDIVERDVICCNTVTSSLVR